MRRLITYYWQKDEGAETEIPARGSADIPVHVIPKSMPTTISGTHPSAGMVDMVDTVALERGLPLFQYVDKRNPVQQNDR